MYDVTSQEYIAGRCACGQDIRISLADLHERIETRIAPPTRCKTCQGAVDAAAARAGVAPAPVTLAAVTRALLLELDHLELAALDIRAYEGRGDFEVYVSCNGPGSWASFHHIIERASLDAVSLRSHVRIIRGYIESRLKVEPVTLNGAEGRTS